MRIRYIGHAKDQMQARGVTQSDVEAVLRGGWVERMDTPKNSVRYKGEPQPGRMLKVWVFPDDPAGDKVVKSVAWE